MAPPHATPWYSTVEWVDVYKGIFSNDEQKREAAVARIALWEYKTSTVPVAISSTKLLLETLKAHRRNDRSTGELQMLYGAAIVRFVNGFVDAAQEKRDNKKIAIIARQLGIPIEIVECRHQISHGNMPSLDSLAHCAGLAFDYLAAVYWHPQMQTLAARAASQAGLSQHIASGLVALAHDLEALSCPEEQEQALVKLVKELSPDIPVQRVLFAAAQVSSLRTRDAIRALRRLGLPQFASEPAFLAITLWCSELQRLLPQLTDFLDVVLRDGETNENLLLSFLKDFLLIAFDPDAHVAAVVAFFYILGRSSPTLTARLVHRMINTVLSPSCHYASSQSPEKIDALIHVSDTPQTRALSGAPNTFLNKLQSDGTLELEEVSFVIQEEDDSSIGGYCFHHPSFELWLRAVDVSPDEGAVFAADLQNTAGLRARVAAWLRTLLLLSSNPLAPVGMSLELVLSLNPAVGAQSCSIIKNAPTKSSSTSAQFDVVQDRFLQRLLHCVNVTQARTLTACAANLPNVARRAFTLYFLITQEQQPRGDPNASNNNAGEGGVEKSKNPSEHPHALSAAGDTTVFAEQKAAMKMMLAIFDEADIRSTSPGGPAAVLMDWVTQRLFSSPAPGREGSGKGSLPVTRMQQRSLLRLLSYPNRSMEGTKVASTTGHKVSQYDQFSKSSVSINRNPDPWLSFSEGKRLQLMERFRNLLTDALLKRSELRGMRDAGATIGTGSPTESSVKADGTSPLQWLPALETLESLRSDLRYVEAEESTRVSNARVAEVVNMPWVSLTMPDRTDPPACTVSVKDVLQSFAPQANRGSGGVKRSAADASNEVANGNGAIRVSSNGRAVKKLRRTRRLGVGLPAVTSAFGPEC